jgi:hypothetical protein
VEVSPSSPSPNIYDMVFLKHRVGIVLNLGFVITKCQREIYSGIKGCKKCISFLCNWNHCISGVNVHVTFNSYITGFQMSNLSGEKDRWRDVWWVGWHLAKAPPELKLHKETSEASDTSSWQM